MPDRFLSANRCFSNKQYAQALDHVEAYIASSSHSPNLAKNWAALIIAGRCIERLKPRHPHALRYFLEAFDLLPERSESIYYLGNHYLTAGQHQEAYDLVQLVVNDAPVEYEFGDIDVYRFKLKHLFIRCNYALGRNEECINLANDFLANLQLPEYVRLDVSALRARAYARRDPLKESTTGKQNRFLIVIAFHNPGAYLSLCVESINRQSYSNFRVILIDDASDDSALDNCTLNPQFKIIRHQKRSGALVSAHEAILRYAKPDDIIIHLDGDDAFEHELALEKINQLYEASGCWVLYGQYRVDTGHIGHARPFYKDELDHPPLTRRPMAFPIHVRSYRAGLYHQIKFQDPHYSVFKDTAGKWLTSAIDIAQMRTVFQLAGHPHIRFNSEPVYRYNYQNPMGNHFVAKEKQKQFAAEIAKHRVFKPVRHYLPAISSRPSAKLSAQAHKVMCIGIDGGNPDILKSMLSRGLLPNLQALLGHQAPIRIKGIESHTGDGVFWPSIYTRQNSIDHGRLFRIQPDLFDPTPTPFYMAQNLFAPPFWNDLLVHQRKVTLIDLPYTPKLADKNLTAINNWLAHEPEDSFYCHPADLLSRLENLEAKEDIFVTFGKSARKEQYQSHFELFRKRIKRKQSVNIALAKQQWDFYMTVYGEMHDAGHYWWHQHDPSHRLYCPELKKQFGDILEHTYTCVDEEIPELLKCCDQQTHIFLICGLAMGNNISCNAASDQIFHQLQQFWHQSSAHCTLSEGLKSGQLTLQLMPYNNNALPIKIQTDNSETYNKEAAAIAIEQSLLKIINPVTNQAVVKKIFRTPALNTHVDHPFWPDLFIEWRRDSFIDRVYSDEIGEIKLPPAQNLDCRSGDHRPDAVLYMNGAALDLHGDSQVTAREVGKLMARSAGLIY